MDIEYIIRNELLKRHITLTELSNRLGVPRQNTSSKLKRINSKLSDLEKIANALDCELSISFIPRDNVNQ